jgi:large subunit ribosomal protein L32e
MKMAEEDEIKKTKDKEKNPKKSEAVKKTPPPPKKKSKTSPSKDLPKSSPKKTEPKKDEEDIPKPKPKKVTEVGKETPKPKVKKVAKKPEESKPKEKKEAVKGEEEGEVEIVEEEGEAEIVEEEEDIEIVEEEETEYIVKIKPKLGKDLRHELRIRKTIKRKTPHFRQQEWFRYKRINQSWRKPRGMHSKMRKHKGYRPNVVSVGYGSPLKTRNLHPSGFEEIMIFNPKDLDKINPKKQAARVGHSVGTRKRIEIEKIAEKKGIRVLNPRRL